MKPAAGFRLATIVLACGFLGWVVLRLWSRGAFADPRPPAIGASEALPSAESSGSGVSLDTRRAESGPARLKPRRFSESEPSEAAPASTGEGRKLRVVLAPGDAPAAGAIVEVNLIDSEDQIQGFEGGEPRTAVKPATIVADGKGTVDLPPFKLVAFVHGRSGALRGRTVVMAEVREEAVLRLRRCVSALVVDAAGVPQSGVPVAIENVETGYPRERGKTGPDGIFVFVQDEVHGQRRRAPDRKATLAVALALPLADRVEKRVDPEDPPESPLELVLPPVCTVVVRLVRLDGAPFTGGARIALQPKREGAPFAVVGARFDCLTSEAAEGAASFTRVGLSGPLEITVMPADRALRTVDATLDGPRAAGGETVATVACGGSVTIVTGRLVTRSGEPVASAELDALIGRVTEVGTSEPDGRFSLRFDLDPATLDAKEIDLGIRVQPKGDSAISEYRPKRMTRPLPASIKTGTADIGDVVVPDAEVLAAGIVVTDAGEPLGHADLTLMRRQFPQWESDDSEVSGLYAVSDGRFEIIGNVKGKGHGLIARLPGWICGEPTPFEPGARDLKIVMTQAGGIEGSVTNFGDHGWGRDSDAPFAIRVTGPKVWLPKRNEGRQYTSGAGLLLGVAENGFFSALELPAGIYGVQIRAHDAADPVFAVSDLVVKAGEINRDPRLQNIDLSKLGRQRVVTVLNEEEKPLQGAKVGVITMKRGSRSTASFETDADGHATVTTRSDSFAAVVAMKGYGAVTLPNVTADVTVTLRKAATHAVTIKLADSVALPESPLSIDVALTFLCALHEARPSESDWNDPRTDNGALASFRSDRSATFHVQNPGIYEVHLSLMMKTGLGSSGPELEQKGGKATVTVLETGEPSLTVDVDPAELARRIADVSKEK